MGSVNRRGTALRFLTWDESLDVKEEKRYALFLQALTEMLSAYAQDTVIRVGKISYAKVYDQLNPLVSRGIEEHDDPRTYTANLFEDSNARYKKANKTGKTAIQSPLAYMKTIIYSALLEDDIHIEDLISHDFPDNTRKNIENKKFFE